MPETYTVKQGDYLAKIATDHGFAEWKWIWDHARNKALKDKRKDSNILFPGDEVYIPDKDDKEVPAVVDKKHRFQVKRVNLKLIVVLDEMFKRPMATVNYQLVVNNQTIAKKTDGAGKLEVEIPPGTTDAQLIIRYADTPADGLTIPLKVGHLNPVEEHSGQAQRLSNLGYFPGPFPEKNREENDKIFRSAVQEFQCDHRLVVDGDCGPRTQGKLVEVHGC